MENKRLTRSFKVLRISALLTIGVLVSFLWRNSHSSPSNVLEEGSTLRHRFYATFDREMPPLRGQKDRSSSPTFYNVALTWVGWETEQAGRERHELVRFALGNNVGIDEVVVCQLPSGEELYHKKYRVGMTETISISVGQIEINLISNDQEHFSVLAAFVLPEKPVMIKITVTDREGNQRADTLSLPSFERVNEHEI